MKILYWTVANQDFNLIPTNIRADYLSDLLFHGLRELLGENVIDYPKKKYLYTNFTGNTNEFWGKGFSYIKTLKDIEIDRSIDLNKFDLIVLSVHHTIHRNPYVLHQILHELNNKTKAKIAVVDGNDEISTYEFALDYTQYLFKREIPSGEKRFIPIHFAMPIEKFVSNIPQKSKYIADIVPCDHNHPNRKTHSYNIEELYYNDYRSSWFALTCIKGGADCARHIEIIMNASLPIFSDWEKVASRTLTNLPRKLLSDIKDWPFLKLPSKTFSKNDIKLDWNYIDESKFDKQLCEDTINYLLEYGRKNLTTLALAKYFLEKIC